MNIESLLYSGFIFDKNEQDLKKKYLIYNILLLGAIFITLIVFIVDLMILDSKYNFIELLALVIFVFTFFMLRKTVKQNYQIFSNIILIFFIFLVLFTSYKTYKEPIISNWYMATILPIAYLYGIRIVMFIFFIFSIAFFYIEFYVANNIYTTFIYSEYIPMILVTWFVYLYHLQSIHSSGVTQEVTAQSSILEQEINTLKYQLHHDNLTGLKNRDNLNSMLKDYIHTSDDEKKFAVLFIDLDRFKKVNDSFGHDMGDRILQSITKRFLKVINEHMHLFRLSGDEFIILVDEFAHKQELIAISRALINISKQPFSIKEDTVFLSCSIGISIYPTDSKNDFELMKHADTAMFEAKKQSGKGYCFYSDDMNETNYNNIILETELHYALDNKELELYYQPQVDIVENKIIGAEVLLRWNHKRLGFLRPGEFLDNAVNSSLITLIDEYVFEEGMKQVVKWHRDNINLGRVSFNITIKSLEDERIVHKIEMLLAKTGCKGEWIELEILENDIMFDIEKSVKVLKMFKNLGIKISLDDFGVGYSSLTYLKKLPIDKIKVDRSFVIEITSNKEDKAVVDAIIAISKTLNVNLIIEGVETKKQYTYFKNIGCRYMQGNYCYTPMSHNDCKALLLNQT